MVHGPHCNIAGHFVADIQGVPRTNPSLGVARWCANVIHSGLSGLMRVGALSKLVRIACCHIMKIEPIPDYLSVPRSFTNNTLMPDCVVFWRQRAVDCSKVAIEISNDIRRASLRALAPHVVQPFHNLFQCQDTCITSYIWEIPTRSQDMCTSSSAQYCQILVLCMMAKCRLQ